MQTGLPSLVGYTTVGKAAAIQFKSVQALMMRLLRLRECRHGAVAAGYATGLLACQPFGPHMQRICGKETGS